MNARIDRPKVLTLCGDLLFTANNQAAYELGITSKGIFFEATARRILDLTINCIPHGLA